MGLVVDHMLIWFDRDEFLTGIGGPIGIARRSPGSENLWYKASKIYGTSLARSIGEMACEGVFILMTALGGALRGRGYGQMAAGVGRCYHPMPSCRTSPDRKSYAR